MFDFHFSRKITAQEKWLFVLTVFPLYMFSSSIIGNAIIKFLVINFHISADLNTLNAYLNLIVDLGMVLYVIWAFKDTLKKQWVDFKDNVLHYLFEGCIVGMAILYGVAIIGGLLTMVLGGADISENQQTIETLTIAHPLIMMITSVLLAPILEEIVFRCGVFGWSYEINPYIAHLLSGFLFGFVHIMMALLAGNLLEWTQIFTYFFTGVGLSFIYERNNNIFTSMLAHMTNNLLSMILILFI